MAGHIVSRKGKKKINGKLESLYYVVYVVNGKQKWEKVYSTDRKRRNATLKEAEKLLAERLVQINRGEFIEPSRITFEEFKDIWMEKYAVGEGEIKDSTLTLYRGLFRNHLVPAFGDKQLSAITVEDIQGFKAEKTTAGLSAQTVKHMLQLLRQMLDHAIDWGYIRTNPAKKVRSPRIPKKEMEALAPEEVRAFLEQVPEKWYAFFLVAISGGLRIGELLAMRWANLTWKTGQYFVKETLLRPQEGRPTAFGSPKTSTSVAPVDLSPLCLDALQEHRKRQAEEKLRAGEDYRDQGLVFATAKGTPLNDRNIVQRVFEPALQDAGLRRIRFHDLRHTCASLLIAQGESPKYVQKQMRHASIRITFDNYGHLFPDANREAARRFDEALFGAPSQVAQREPV